MEYNELKDFTVNLRYYEVTHTMTLEELFGIFKKQLYPTFTTTKLDPTAFQQDACSFGEMYRNAVFQEEYGCYSCFDLQEDFKKVAKTSEIYQWALRALDLDPRDPDDTDNIYYMQVWTDGTFDVAWYWDGDGVLAIRTQGITAVNRDCKKDYTWVFLNDD